MDLSMHIDSFNFFETILFINIQIYSRVFAQNKKIHKTQLFWYEQFSMEYIKTLLERFLYKLYYIYF